jgi:hypothetical protein
MAFTNKKVKAIYQLYKWVNQLRKRVKNERD